MPPNMDVKTGDEVLDNKITEWISWNRNEAMEAEAKEIVKRCNKSELESLFMNRLAFGTAGLRGAMGPGYCRMNHLVVIQTAQGLLSYLRAVDPDLNQRGIVIGYDGRHNSRDFAELSASVFLRNNVPVFLFSDLCPTPFVSFGVVHLKASAGVMVTASHNPKQDNGYKVYWDNGAQIIPPIDKGISAAILENLEPWKEVWDVSILKDNHLLHDPLGELMEAYTKAVVDRLVDPTTISNCSVSMTYTPMHGVGYPFIKHVFQAAGFKELVVVEEQKDPDGDFPTVEFPNPEEGKSALELSMSKADASDSPIILANDPDADRLAVAEKTMRGDWKVFTGNELGGLLGWWEMKAYKTSQQDGTDMSNAYMMSSTVSSKIVRSICQKEGLNFEETLTGFKWMGNRAQELVKEGKKVLFAFEEAIGFMVSSVVPDKDGVSAAVRVAEIVAYLYSRGSNLQEQLEQIYSIYGHHVSKNSYFICHEPATIKKIFQRLRNFSNESNSYPQDLAGIWKVKCVRDLTTGYDSEEIDGRAKLPVSASSQMITFTFDNGLVATLRTSGTEPKIKYYTELCASPDIKDVEEVKNTLNEMVDAIIQDMFQPKQNNLIYRSFQ